MKKYAEVSMDFYNQLKDVCDKYEESLNKEILTSQEELRKMASDPNTDILEFNKKTIECSKLMNASNIMTRIIGDAKSNIMNTILSVNSPFTINPIVADVLKEIPVEEDGEEDGPELEEPAGFVSMGDLGADFRPTETTVCAKMYKKELK